jgi:predicted nucleic acid-binding protein
VIYLDSSAIVKLARQELETTALRQWLAVHPAPVFSSALARAECGRALLRSQPTAIPVLRSVLATLLLCPITDAVLNSAATLPGVSLRSLDAIHLATAEEFRHALKYFVSYDKRLCEAAERRGLQAFGPA